MSGHLKQALLLCRCHLDTQTHFVKYYDLSFCSGYINGMNELIEGNKNCLHFLLALNKW